MTQLHISGDDGDNFRPSSDPQHTSVVPREITDILNRISAPAIRKYTLSGVWASIFIPFGDPQRRFSICSVGWGFGRAPLIHYHRKSSADDTRDDPSPKSRCLVAKLTRFFSHFLSLANQNYILCSSIHHTVTVPPRWRDTSGESPAKTTKKRLENEEKKKILGLVNTGNSNFPHLVFGSCRSSRVREKTKPRKEKL
jgi:hypothetical protein